MVEQLNCSYRHLLDWSVESIKYIQYHLNDIVPVSGSFLKYTYCKFIVSSILCSILAYNSYQILRNIIGLECGEYKVHISFKR